MLKSPFSILLDLILHLFHPVFFTQKPERLTKSISLIAFSDSQINMRFFTPFKSSNPNSAIHEVFLALSNDCYAIGSLQSSLRDFESQLYVDEYDLTENLLCPAIEESKTYVIVFTENFVYAPYSRMIFEKVMECQRRKNMVVLAVFCVENDVQDQIRAVRFEEAFENLMKATRYDDKLRWKMAAAGASVESSWELSIPSTTLR